jgi:hypothetical protein
VSTEARREYFWAAQAWYRLTLDGWVLDAEQGPAPKVEIKEWKSLRVTFNGLPFPFKETETIEWPNRTQGLYPKRKR